MNNENFNLWFSGFIDGEGCFSVSARFRERNNLGIEIQTSFSVAQKKSSGHLKLLQGVRDYLNTGAIRGDKNCYKYETRKLYDIIKIIIPFFEKYPLKTDKQKDFINFKEICSRMQKKEHLTSSGLIKILKIMSLMNLSGTRRFSIEELVLFLENNQRKQTILEQHKNEELVL